MGVVAHLGLGAIEHVATTHPQLARLRTRLTGELHLDPAVAGRLIGALVIHAVEDLGDAFLGEMGTRLRRIDSVRGQIAGAIDHVLAEGAMPPGLDHAGIGRLFDELQRDMEGLRSARRFAETRSSDPDIDAILGAIGPVAAPAASSPFGPTADPMQGVAGPRPPGVLREAMTTLAQERPQRAALLQRHMRTHGDAIGLALLAETETIQLRELGRLRDALGSGIPDAELNELQAAIQELGRARSRALHGPGTAAARVRAERVAALPPALRSRIGNDNTLLGALAEQHPADLHALWDAWQAGNQAQDFRAYVYGEMRSGRRPALAEWQLAHDLGTRHDAGLLKDPASFDAAAANGRRVNPREGGTDVVALREDGEIWYVDDKSHRLSQSAREAGATGISLSGVSAFESRLAANMAADAVEMEADLARIAAAGRTPNPRAVEAAGRIRRCGAALARETAGWPPEAFLVPANQAKVLGILNSHRVALKVSSTMGDVTGMTARLAGLKIGVLP